METLSIIVGAFFNLFFISIIIKEYLKKQKK